MRARTRQSSLPWPGNWYVPDFQVSSDEGLVELEERRRERARILLDRYGVLFREILGREQGVFAWREIFPALRLMELAGEVVGGQMFTGASAPQFMTLAGLRRLARTVDRRDVYWFNATDPASLCGLGISGLKGVLPERRPGTHLVFRGRDLVLVSRGHGKVLDIRVEQDDPDLPLMLEPLRHMLTRRINPRRRLKVESINEEAALASPYLDTLRSCFKALPDHSKVTLFPLVP